MLVTKELLEGLYQEYCQTYFKGRLPTCPMYTHSSIIRLGVYNYELGVHNEVKRHSISITNSYDMTDEQLRDILLHEMLHEYLMYYRIDSSGKHPKAFVSRMEKLNKKYGLHLSVKTDLSDFKLMPLKFLLFGSL